jgi:hypothetical protein
MRSMPVRCQVIFKNEPHQRFEDFGYASFHACPRIGEYLEGVDPDEVHTLVRVISVTHRNGSEFPKLVVVSEIGK